MNSLVFVAMPLMIFHGGKSFCFHELSKDRVGYFVTLIVSAFRIGFEYDLLSCGIACISNIYLFIVLLILCLYHIAVFCCVPTTSSTEIFHHRSNNFVIKMTDGVACSVVNEHISGCILRAHVDRPLYEAPVECTDRNILSMKTCTA